MSEALQKLQFEPHNGYGRTDPETGDPWPFGYISTMHPSPIFEMNVILGGYEADDLRQLVLKMVAAPELLEALEGTLAETIESRNALHEGASLPDGSYDDPEDAAEIARIDGIIARAQAAIARATGQEAR